MQRMGALDWVVGTQQASCGSANLEMLAVLLAAAMQVRRLCLPTIAMFAQGPGAIQRRLLLATAYVQYFLRGRFQRAARGIATTSAILYAQGGASHVSAESASPLGRELANTMRFSRGRPSHSPSAPGSAQKVPSAGHWKESPVHENHWEDDDDQDDEEETTAPCPYCRRPIYDDTPWCPHCGNYLSNEDTPHSAKPWWIYVGAVLVLYIVYLWIVR